MKPSWRYRITVELWLFSAGIGGFRSCTVVGIRILCIEVASFLQKRSLRNRLERSYSGGNLPCAGSVFDGRIGVRLSFSVFPSECLRTSNALCGSPAPHTWLQGTLPSVATRYEAHLWKNSDKRAAWVEELIVQTTESFGSHQVIGWRKELGARSSFRISKLQIPN